MNSPKEKLFGPEGLFKEWEKQILELIPKGSFQPVDLLKYGKAILEEYTEKYLKNRKFEDPTDRRRAELKMIEKIGEETFVAATFLPCDHSAMRSISISGNQVEMIIKHPDQIGVNYLCIPEIERTPLNQHVSTGKSAGIYFKQIKKMKQIRKFHRPSSVFA